MGVSENCKNQFAPSAMWVLETELKPSGLILAISSY